MGVLQKEADRQGNKAREMGVGENRLERKWGGGQRVRLFTATGAVDVFSEEDGLGSHLQTCVFDTQLPPITLTLWSTLVVLAVKGK